MCCACLLHVCVCVFIFIKHKVLLISMYFSRCKEKLYFHELQRFVGVEKKGDQSETFL